MFKDKFQQYSSLNFENNIDHKFWIPGTNLGVHFMELKPRLINKYFSRAKETILKNNKRAKNVYFSDPKAHDGNFLSLYELIGEWDKFKDLDSDARKALIRRVSSAINEQYIDRNMFFTHTYEEVMRGQKQKRGFRLHFQKTFLNFSVPKGSAVEDIALQLKSLTEYGLLLTVSRENLKKLLSSRKLFCHLTIQDIFQQKSQHDESVLKVKPCFEIDRKLLSYYSESFENLYGIENLFFLHVPYDAIYDYLLMEKSIVGESLRHKLRETQEMFYKSIDQVA
jgi:hypothetical protein